MPLPTPNTGETEDDFISRCIKFVMDEGTISDNKQVAAICYSQWRKHKGRIVRTVFRTMNATIIDNPSIENKSKSKTNRSRQGAYTAIAMVGDQFWNKGRTKEFCLFDGIKNGYKSMDKTFHNLDHGSDPHGTGHIRIQDIVGVQDYTEIDHEKKQMIMYIYPDEHMPSYGTWKAFIDMCQSNNKTPNVSIEAMVTQEQMKASDIPVKDLDYKSLDILDDDLVWVETDYRFVGAATVYMGACDEQDGCGIVIPEETLVQDSSCDCNNVKITINIDDKINEEKIMTEEIRIEEKKPETDLRVQEIETLKNKLVTCSETHKQVMSENEGYKKKIEELEKTVKELTEKLSKPITTLEENTKELTKQEIGILALKKIMKK